MDAQTTYNYINNAPMTLIGFDGSSLYPDEPMHSMTL